MIFIMLQWCGVQAHWGRDSADRRASYKRSKAGRTAMATVWAQRRSTMDSLVISCIRKRNAWCDERFEPKLWGALDIPITLRCTLRRCENIPYLLRRHEWNVFFRFVIVPKCVSPRNASDRSCARLPSPILPVAQRSHTANAMQCLFAFSFIWNDTIVWRILHLIAQQIWMAPFGMSIVQIDFMRSVSMWCRCCLIRPGQRIFAQGAKHSLFFFSCPLLVNWFVIFIENGPHGTQRKSQTNQHRISMTMEMYVLISKRCGLCYY